SLLNVKGIGEQKVDNYGEDILKVIREFIQDNPDSIEELKGLANDEPREVNVSSRRKGRENDSPSFLETYELYNDGKNIDEIAELRGI
ncbi:hypothetical protein, partial [Pseudomonas sp. 2822-17]|uniref:hypothetical protein n=1 Tax=Pseudomonas sp. 2822-17 TaxID=1712678 RepID=UPI001C48959A